MRHVAIVGGGLAGLSCSFALKRRGIPSLVFEASGRPGGRSAAGPYLLGPDAYRNTFELANTLGLGADLIEIPPVAGQLYKGRVYHHRVSSATGLLGFKGLNLADKAMLSRMALLLLRYSSKLDFHCPERGVELDDETVAAFVKRELTQNILNYVAGPLISTLFFYSSEETSKLLYLNLARYMHHIRMFTLRGGVQRLAEAAAAQVDIVRGRRVNAITWQNDGYSIDGRKFSDVVIAVPGNELATIGGLEDLLGDEDRRFFANCRYGRAVRVFFETAGAIEQCYAVSIPRVERWNAATIVFHKFIDPASEGVSVVGGGDSGTAASLIQEARHLFPELTTEPAVEEWSSAMPKFPPGRVREIAAVLSRPRRPGIDLCGVYLIGPMLE
jgi:protoporphyrinogen oxidase